MRTSGLTASKLHVNVDFRVLCQLGITVQILQIISSLMTVYSFLRYDMIEVSLDRIKLQVSVQLRAKPFSPYDSMKKNRSAMRTCVAYDFCA